MYVCMCVWGDGAVKGRMKGSVDTFGFFKKYHSLKVLLCNILEKNWITYVTSFEAPKGNGFRKKA